MEKILTRTVGHTPSELCMIFSRDGHAQYTQWLCIRCGHSTGRVSTRNIQRLTCCRRTVHSVIPAVNRVIPSFLIRWSLLDRWDHSTGNYSNFVYNAGFSLLRLQLWTRHPQGSVLSINLFKNRITSRHSPF